MGETGFDKGKTHQYFSVACFNDTWGLIEKQDRTLEDEEEMLQLTMASAWHWSQREDCTPQNLSIAYWQISRVHALCGRGDEALRYGKLCLEASQADEIDPFSLAYAYEALARAASVAGDTDRCEAWIGEARQVAEGISDEETKKMILDDLATID